MPLKKVIVSGGGTGGHIFPALSIAKALQEMHPNMDVLFVGAVGKMEMEKVPRAGFRIVGLEVEGFKRKLSLDNLRILWKFGRALRAAKKILRDFQPDVVIGVGGYASAALVYKAGKMGIPVVIQEQNSFPGITNKRVARFASLICVAYPGMEKYFPSAKIAITGNPIRPDIQHNVHTREEACKFFGLDAGKPVVFVFGGSQGAKAINEGMVNALERLAQDNIQVIWQTGKPFYAQAVTLKTASVQVFEFVEQMPMAYAAADLVVGRAGAISVAEIAASGLPAILVPLPTAAEDHQTKNAMALVHKEAAVLLKNENTPGELGDYILELIRNVARRNELARNIKEFAHTNAAKLIAQKITEIIA